jgi:TolB-like protein/AraC-like DNA-binding protein
MNSSSSSNSEFITTLTNIVELNLTHPQFGVSVLARELNMSRSNLHRKVKSISKVSVSQLIREIRLNIAMEMLNQSHISASDVAYKVGFGSATYFNKCFHDHFGYPPGEVGKMDTKLTNNLPLPKQQSKGKKRLYSIAVLFIFIVCIQSLVIYFVFKPFPIGGNGKIKSIAVLPIADYGNYEEGYSWILNGLRDNLISKLEVLENLNVVSRTNSDLYLGKQKSIKEISKMLDADYLLEGSGQRVNGKIKIQFQLIETKTDKYLWSKPFVREITEDDFLSFQDEVALLVVSELNTVVTKKEKEKMLTPETENIAAYNLYLQGKNFLEIYEQMPGSDFSQTSTKKFVPLELAKAYFEKALKLDSSYSQAYVGLGWYYHIKSELNIFDAEKSDHYLDSALYVAEKAIIHNSDFADGFDLQSCIYAHKGIIPKAKKSSDKLIAFNQRNWQAYYRVADNYQLMNLCSRAVRYYLLAKELNREPLKDIKTIKGLYSCLVQKGFIKEAKQQIELLLSQENDSLDYYRNLSHIQFCIGNLDQALEYQLKAHALDETNAEGLIKLSIIYLTLRDQNKMIHYFNLYKSSVQQNYTDIAPNKYVAYINSLLGEKEEADYHYKQVLENNIKRQELGTCNHFSYASSYEIACIYSVTGEPKKAIHYLQHYEKENHCPLWLLTSLQNNPMLDNIRDTEEFRNILDTLDKIFRAEKIRTDKVLTQEGNILS